VTRRASLAIGLAVVVGACAGNRLGDRADATDRIIATARESGAQRCAPVELAMAESHNDFARQELSEGNYHQARHEVEVAESNAQSALDKSPKERCNPDTVVAPGPGDADGDQILDDVDECPRKPEDKDGFEDGDGCPEDDNDADGIADAIDDCPLEPEDRDGTDDTDGCPDPDNDKDGIADKIDQCPDEAEDVDGFEDDDGCADEDNDGDGFADKGDRCPNDPETVNGVDDDDGCPDIRAQTGPQEAADRIDLRGNKVEFAGNSDRLTNASRIILGQVASLIKDRTLTIRVEVHTALGTRSKNARQITRQKQRDKDLSQRRAQAILDYLAGQGVPLAQLQAVGLGSDRPLGANPPEDSINERVDFIKAQQRQP
jgi:OOP family OmpA-OmpF porin